ncbi:TonB-dependent receptor plug domain-containing protein [Neolewinella aurantiaca]|nr:TonB-dependent receptor [Neolewinella aurantiaca]
MNRIHLSTLLLLFVTGSLLAQTEGEQLISTSAEEVVVTGAKFAQLQSDSPQNVSVIDSATVARSTDLGQLLNEQAGIVINGAYSNPGKDKSVFLRNGANQYTLILLDGQPLLDPSSLGGAVDLRLLSLDGIERIEILRGPQSLLYGSDAVAGVINLISKKGAENPASPKRPALHLRAAAQNYGTLDGGISVSGHSQKLDYQVGYDYFKTDGISEAVEPEGSTAEYNEDGAKRQTVNGSVTYRPTPNLSLRPALRYATFDGDYDAGSFQDGANTYTNEMLMPSIAVDYSKNKLSLGGRYSYTKSDRAFNDAVFGTSNFNASSQQTDVFGTWLPTEKTYLTAGVQHRDERLRPEDPGTNGQPGMATTSPYLQLGVQLTPILLTEAGYRFNSRSGYDAQSNYSLALMLQASETFSARASLSSAYQNPTIDQLEGPFGANPDLQPQVATSVDAGVVLREPDGDYSLNFNVFRRIIKDVVTYDFALGYQNRDELSDIGFELSGTGTISPRLAVNGNVSYVKGKLSQPDGNGGTTETDDFYRRPRTTGMLGLTYTGYAPFLVRLSAHYTGERPDIYFDENFSSFEVELDPYLIVNAYAEYRLLKRENLRLFVDVKNLTNTDFVEVTGFGVLGTTARIGASLTL